MNSYFGHFPECVGLGLVKLQNDTSLAAITVSDQASTKGGQA